MKKVLIGATVISFIEWFNKENIDFLKDKLNCEVHIACDLEYMHDTDEKRTKEYIQQLKEKGVILHNITFDRSPLGKRNIAAYRQLKKLIRDIHFDLIHCHTPSASALIRLAARNERNKGTRVMYTCHGFHFHKQSPKKNWLIYYPIEKYLSRYCDFLVTINREDFNMASDFNCRNVRYIPGVGVDIRKIKNTKVNRTEIRESLGISDDAVVIISAGELIERKNHEIIIRALSKVNDPKIIYLICGKGPLKGYLENIAGKLQLGKQVKLLGFRNDITELCKASDISAFPSKIEGLGIAGIEAMAAGLPLISSNVHGILDYVIDGRTGVTCPPNDINKFAEAIELLTNDIELRECMGREGIKVIDDFDKENALNVMWTIYKEILCD